MDGFRFFAVTFVVVLHISSLYRNKSALAGVRYTDTTLGSIVAQGAVGVPLFFAISGFILCLPFAEHYQKSPRPRLRLQPYFLRRITRLEPTYFLAITFYFFVEAYVHKHGLRALMPHLFASLGYSHNLIFRAPTPILVAAWSLEIEVQFYILAPLLSAVFLVRSATVRVGAIMFAIAASSMLPQLLPTQVAGFVKLTLLGQIGFFLVGFILVQLYLEPPPKSWMWDIVSSIGWIGVLLPYEGHVGVGVAAVAQAASIFLAYQGALSGYVWNRIVRNRWLVTIGGMCYTIYLSHKFTLGVFVNRGIGKFSIGSDYGANLLLQLVLGTLVVFASAAFLFLFIEQPFMRKDWPRRVVGRFVRRDDDRANAQLQATTTLRQRVGVQGQASATENPVDPRRDC